MRRLVLSLILIGLSGCTVSLQDEQLDAVVVNECDTDSDCPAGECRIGSCVAPEGQIDTLLLEVTPPTSAPGIGGRRIIDVVSGFSENRDNVGLNLPLLANVRGFVRAYDPAEQADCLAGAMSTLPVKMTLMPRESTIGLTGVGYVATRPTSEEIKKVSPSNPCGDRIPEGQATHELALSVPAGDYDIYIEPDKSILGEDSPCVLPPARLDAVTLTPGSVCLALASVRPQPLKVVVEWPPVSTEAQSLDGWTVDVVHPVTGQVLSTKGRLTEASVSVDGTVYESDIAFSPISGGATELVRLSPPDGAIAPTIQLVLSGLVAVIPGQALIGNIEPFPAPVRLEGRLLRKAEFEQRDVPVAANVTLTATSLDGITDGIFASFSTTTTVGDDGRLSVVLLPGEYRVRVEPPVLSGLSASETTLDVACPRSADDPERCAPREGPEPERVQAGKSFPIPEAAKVTGEVVSALGRRTIEGATVAAQPGRMRARKCSVDAGPECESSTLGVLDLALAEDAFVPRAATTLVDNSDFSLAEVDCGGCEPGGGAVFDFYVRPVDGAGFPWSVRAGITIDGSEDLGQLRVPLPIIHRGILQVQRGELSPLPIGGALIRAYALRGPGGAVIDDPEAPPCASGTPESEDCVRSLLQVAETRARDDGSFILVLPSRLE